jgi:RNA polymerase sigma-70 factor, ECF subfamily
MDFSELYRRYAPDVHRFALYLTGQHSDAEDITAETFARVWVSTEPLRVTSVKAYLFTIARNLHRQGWRTRSRQVPMDEEMRDPGIGPAEQVAQQQRLQSMLAGLQRLPEVSRAALLMYAVDGMPYEQIAEVLNVSLAAVKVKIHRARVALAPCNDDSSSHAPNAAGGVP